MSSAFIGILLALSAAALNASIGIFSKVLLQHGLNPQDIAFYKTAIAFLLLSFILIKKPFLASNQLSHTTNQHSTLTSLVIKIALCAFLGIFVLFFFETKAYQYGFASNVVVVLMASAAISALLFGRVLLNEKLTPASVAGTLLAVAGIFVISWSGSSSLAMLINAAIAGTGYGAFSVLVKKFSLNGGIYLTRLFMLFGGIYLFFPFLQSLHPIEWNATIITNLLALAILPTILGFYCTTKALNFLSAAKVQVTELSEPIFAMLMAWAFLSELPSYHFILGALLIILGIAAINQMHAYVLPKTNQNPNN